MPTLLARDADILVTMDDERRELPDAGLFARDGIIEQVGPTEELPRDADVVLDMTGQILLPGFVNTHHHLDQTLTRALPHGQNINLFPWLRAHYLIWGRRTPEASRLCTLVGLAELAASGCTTVFDHTYIFPNGCRLDDQISAAQEIGVRFHASRGSMSLGESQGGLPPDSIVEDEATIFEDSRRVIETYHDASHGSMTRIVLAPCSPFSVTPELLRETAELARAYGVRLHTHLCETWDEERFTLTHFQQRPVAWMETMGWLGDDVWFAHAVHVNDDEIREFARTGAGVAHCPCSNMRLASGIAPVKKYLAAGVRVGLGVDGSASNDASNILLEARQAMLLARLRIGLLPPEGPHSLLSTSDPLRSGEWMTAREALEIATRGGAAVLGRSDIGALAPGMCADFFSIDLNTVDYAGALNDPVAATMFCAPQKARYTVINGRVVVENGRVTTADMDPVIEAHNRFSRELASTQLTR
ncbi:MAG TPA: 8-oxoguanine deaminase [Ardenticatenaceae bacterium]|nr:8-oxoguanine deaminase [Ardenticatenaceae bacterium]